MRTRRDFLNGLALAGLGAVLALAGAAEPAVRRGPTRPLSERERFGHLLRRAGFGARPGEVEAYQSLGWEAAVDRLIDYAKVPNGELEDRLSSLGLDLSKPQDLQRWWLLRMAYTARPLEEKLTLFWHGLLTSGLSKAPAPLMLAQNRFLREHALADYRTILKGIGRDPAMMRWLDISGSVRARPNENYARELMELFSLGVGHYTEQDVREAARAFTGFVVDREGRVDFIRARHDDGLKTVLGRTGRWGPDDIIDIILDRPEAAVFLARKLLRFFVRPDPSEASIDEVARVLRETGFSVKSALRRLFTLPEFASPEAYRSLVKSPAEYVAGAIRQLGVETDGSGLPAVLARMGQTLFNPPNVAGWPGGPAWLNTATWLARLNFANWLTTDRRRARLDPAVWFPAGRVPPDPGAFIDRLGELLLDGNVGEEQREVLLEFGSAAAGDPERWFDGRGRGLVYLMLAMPEYHLA